MAESRWSTVLYQISDGTVSAGGRVILEHIDFEIRGTEKIAVVGANGAGKSTLLRLIAGELSLDRDDRRAGAGITCSRSVTIGILSQQAFSGKDQTVEEEILASCPQLEAFSREQFAYEQEYERLFIGFGFQKADKKKLLSSFSGGEQTKIALIRLLLEKPDILLLDEPTNHLDLETVEWLERYLRSYEKAVVMVSHDRFFLDRTAQIVYELEGKKLVRYSGNYTYYKEEKVRRLARQKKAWESQQEEYRRLGELVERFKHKPNKAAFARAKKKQMERMERVEKPVENGDAILTGDFTPLIVGSKWVYEAEHLKFGWDRPLMELSLRIRRGQKIGLLGKNGAGKTTFLRTVAGFLPKLAGEARLGNNITIGYFDQHAAEITSPLSVVEHFHNLFPSMTEKEVRQTLGGYLFGGQDAAKPVSNLSGGEKARLVLAELLTSRPNFLILDEPTNHMDIRAKERLEEAFRAYTGTILFVSHDRYFIRQVAESVLIFEEGRAMYYPFGYEHYLERMEREAQSENPAARISAEEQALIAGLKAVPKAERHRLREIPTEIAYQEWKLGLLREEMERAKAAYEQTLETMEAWENAAIGEEAWRAWHESCLAWWEELENQL